MPQKKKRVAKKKNDRGQTFNKKNEPIKEKAKLVKVRMIKRAVQNPQANEPQLHQKKKKGFGPVPTARTKKIFEKELFSMNDFFLRMQEPHQNKRDRKKKKGCQRRNKINADPIPEVIEEIPTGENKRAD
jgi:hypothetical protein